MSSVCPSVCLSVTLVDCGHIGWNSSKIISPLVSLGCSLFATPTWHVWSEGNTPKFGPKVTHPPIDLSVGDIRLQIAAEWLQIGAIYDSNKSTLKVALIAQAAQDIGAAQTSYLSNEACHQSLKVMEGRTVSHVQRTLPSHHPGSA